ncbi:TrkH family potassium uptake protein [Ehrlichia ruminantium]|uniref:TrkH family potassium uptake protein n=1 Tax=Ehrlichia ruminantium TaxID=779 RepID=A0AAE6QE02_EHRRU|nr:TrkH family potassium uptake protein [Ehrlichia ruminantium]QGR02906.1 TrkH family potassium uptake protein [Ehrlichia ruminantium]QGR03830.1 TrkH family potassium uptake protein [Ehrlichia ruminantium]QGR04757.1 TrkH family potassium uptake protein [Ehrlichia ruminantium]
MYKSLRSIIFITGVFSLVFVFLMLIPVVVNYYTGYAWQGLFCACFITLLFSFICIFCGKLSRVKKQEIFFITVSVWIMLSIISAMPFMFDAQISYVNAFFESVSGLTTTGATIFTDLQDKSPGLLIWRCLLNAIGGLGIIMTGIFLFPCLKIVGLYELYRSESSDISKNFKYGIVKSSLCIFIIYCVFITLCAILYLVAGMSGFDAICHAMSTVSTGGFSNYDDSLQHFNNVYIEAIAIVFMLLSSCPFIMYLKMITKQCFYDEQVILFAMILLFFSGLSIIVCCYDEVLSRYSFFNTFRYSIFSVVSLSSSTGFINYDYNDWYFFSVVGMVLMLMGGCSGSTNSGIKVYRIGLLVKAINRYTNSLLHTDKTSLIRYGRKCIDNVAVNNIGLFFILYIFILFVGFILVSISGVDVITAFSAVVATFSNTGPGIGNIVGPKYNYYNLLPSVKLLLSFLMLMGRLEIMPFYVCMYLIVQNIFRRR